MASKAVAHDANIDDIAKMLNGKSCAELETLLNEAAKYAGFERSEKITRIILFALCFGMNTAHLTQLQ